MENRGSLQTDQTDTDVGIIGGGPAGASMAAYLAKAGIKCVVFESELFPRPHVGESLVPSSTRVFRDPDFLPTMEEAKFPHKFGAGWTAAANAPVYNHDWEGLGEMHAHVDGPNLRFEERDQPGMDQIYTYHVDRGKFDTLLLQHANKLGAEVYEGVRVSRVDINGGPPTIKYNIGGRETGTTWKIVVDDPARNKKLVRLHSGVLSPERSVHLFHHRRTLSPRCPQAASGRCVRRRSTGSSYPDAEIWSLPSNRRRAIHGMSCSTISLRTLSARRSDRRQRQTLKAQPLRNG